jgi:hypothetical protein
MITPDFPVISLRIKFAARVKETMGIAVAIQQRL